MFFRKRIVRRRAPLRRRVAAKRRAPKVKRALRRVVKSVITRVAETKTAQRYNLGQSVVPANATTFQANIIELGPGSSMVISQGSGQGQRQGNQITTVSHTFKGNLVAFPWNTTTNPNPRPLNVKMWIFYDKTDPVALPQPVTLPFFQEGSGVVGFANDLVDMWRPINTDRYRVLTSKTFKLGFSQNAGTATSTSNQGQFQAYSNNDYKMNCAFSFNLTKHQVKKIRYNDANNEPTTRRMFCMVQPVDATGGTLDQTWIPCGISYMEDFRYKDM